MISFYIKTPKRTSIEKGAKRFLAENYDQEDIQAAEQQVNKAQLLRDVMVAGLQSSSPAPKLIKQHQDYFAQIHLLAKALAFSKAGVKAGFEFTWADSFRENKRASSRRISFEMNCVLYNLAVLHMKHALRQNRKTAAGIKEASQNLRRAASIFAFLIEATNNVPVAEKTMDMAQNCLQVAALLAQAQAQACYFEKAQAEKFSIELISSLAFSVADIYRRAEQKFAGDGALRSWFEKGDYPFHRHISAQKELFLATSFFWASKAALNAKKYGEEITWLSMAKEHVEKAEKFKLKSLHNIIEKSHAEFKKLVEKEHDRATSDNNSIYFSRVPDEGELEKPQGKLFAVVKKMDFTDLQVEDEKNVLSKLVPVAVTKTSRRIRQELLDELEAMVRKNNAENAPHSLALREYSPFLPVDPADEGQERQRQFGSLFADIESLKQRGGLTILKKELEGLKKTDSEVTKRYDAILVALKEESRVDEAHRRRYAAYWARPHSEKIAASYYTEAGVIRNFLSDACKSNQKMETRLEALRPSLSFLETQRPEQIAKTLPSVREQFADAEVVAQIRETVALVQKLLAEKTELLKSAQEEIEGANISSEIVQMRKYDKLDEQKVQQLSAEFRNEKLGNVAAELERLEQRLGAQHEPLSQLGAEFERVSRGDAAFAEKKGLLAKYETALKSFDGLLESIAAGRNFYSDLEALYVNVLLAKVSDFARARGEEAEQKTAELEQMLRRDETGYFGDNMPMTGGLENNFRGMDLNGGYNVNQDPRGPNLGGGSPRYSGDYGSGGPADRYTG